MGLLVHLLTKTLVTGSTTPGSCRIIYFLPSMALRSTQLHLSGTRYCMSLVPDHGIDGPWAVILKALGCGIEGPWAAVLKASGCGIEGP